MLGVVLCAVCLFGSLAARPLHPLVWPLAAFCVLVWPHLAYRMALRAANPLRAERFNLWLDSLFVSFSAAAIGFSLVPTAVLFMATSLGNVTVGGLRLFVLGLVAHVVGAVLGVLVWGIGFQPDSSVLAQWSAVPLLVLYPLLMGGLMYQLASRLNESRRELRFLSEHDALSGVRNRRYFDQYLRQVFSQFQRHERDLSLLVCDVDHFKQVNDRLGHAAGDEVIRQFANALSECARIGDVVARLGGDEFVVLLSDANAEQSFHYAHRVQERLCVLLAASPALPEISVSFGVAMARRSMTDHEHWLEQADSALYRCKEQDRGGVCLSEPDLQSAARAR
jgi:diguanylate cyclase